MGPLPKNVKGTKALKGPHYVPKADRYCVQCDHEFARTCEYRRHLNNTVLHNPAGARRFPCSLCSNKFTHLYNLYNHQRIHTREFEVCSLPLNGSLSETCGRRYTDLPNLRKHMKRDHLDLFTSFGLEPPFWLHDAHKHRIRALGTKCGRKRSVRNHETVTRVSTPPSTPPSTPTLPTPIPSVQIFYADTMELLQPECSAIENLLPEAQLCLVKDQFSPVYRSEAQPFDYEWELLNLGCSNQPILSTVPYDQSNKLAPAPPATSPSLNLSNAQPLALPIFDVAQFPPLTNLDMTQGPSFSNANIAQPSYLSNPDLIRPSLSYDYDASIVSPDPAPQSDLTNLYLGMIGSGAQESFIELQNYRTSFFPGNRSDFSSPLVQNKSFFYDQPAIPYQPWEVGYFDANGPRPQAQVNLFDYSHFTRHDIPLPALQFNL